MDATHYVSTDARGVEHGADGAVHWCLPTEGRAGETDGARLLLRRPAGLLDVLDELIFESVAIGPVTPAGEEAIATTRARLVRQTRWGVGPAAGFALECAAHVLEGVGDVVLPSGITLDRAVTDGRRALQGDGDEDHEHLLRLAELGSLRRLLRDRRLLRASLGIGLAEDNARDLDAIDDPAFDEVRTTVDAVLAALEALRHHLLPSSFRRLEDHREEGEAHKVERAASSMSQAVVVETPWGPGMLGGHTALSGEPAWTAARDAARHARDTAKARAGGDKKAAEEERRWQAARLSTVLDLEG